MGGGGERMRRGRGLKCEGRVKWREKCELIGHERKGWGDVRSSSEEYENVRVRTAWN